MQWYDYITINLSKVKIKNLVLSVNGVDLELADNQDDYATCVYVGKKITVQRGGIELLIKDNKQTLLGKYQKDLSGVDGILLKYTLTVYWRKVPRSITYFDTLPLAKPTYTITAGHRKIYNNQCANVHSLVAGDTIYCGNGKLYSSDTEFTPYTLDTSLLNLAEVVRFRNNRTEYYSSVLGMATSENSAWVKPSMMLNNIIRYYDGDYIVLKTGGIYTQASGNAAVGTLPAGARPYFNILSQSMEFAYGWNVYNDGRLVVDTKQGISLFGKPINLAGVNSLFHLTAIDKLTLYARDTRQFIYLSTGIRPEQVQPIKSAIVAPKLSYYEDGPKRQEQPLVVVPEQVINFHTKPRDNVKTLGETVLDTLMQFCKSDNRPQWVSQLSDTNRKVLARHLLSVVMVAKLYVSSDQAMKGMYYQYNSNHSGRQTGIDRWGVDMWLYYDLLYRLSLGVAEQRRYYPKQLQAETDLRDAIVRHLEYSPDNYLTAIGWFSASAETFQTVESAVLQSFAFAMSFATRDNDYNTYNLDIDSVMYRIARQMLLNNVLLTSGQQFEQFNTWYNGDAAVKNFVTNYKNLDDLTDYAMNPWWFNRVVEYCSFYNRCGMPYCVSTLNDNSVDKIIYRMSDSEVLTESTVRTVTGWYRQDDRQIGGLHD